MNISLKKDEEITGNTTNGTKASYPWLLSITQTVATALLGVALLEVIFWAGLVGEADHLKPDQKLGFKPFANKRISQKAEGFGCFMINSKGMQNDEVKVAKDADTYRIAVFGDSYVESLQVPREQNYCSLLAEQLKAQTGKKVEVLNFGVSNYSLAQDYLRYQTLAKQFKPDLVVIAYRVGETEKVLPDNRQSLAFVRPMLFLQSDGTLKYDDTLIANFYRSSEGKRLLATQWLREYCRTWSVVGRLQQNLAAGNQQLSGKKIPETQIANDETRAKFVDCYWYMIAAILQNWKADCVGQETAFLVMRTPMVHPGQYQLSQNNRETNKLEKTSKDIGAEFINIDKLLSTEVAKDNLRAYFLEGSHFSKTMHLFVAKQLSKKIAGRLDTTKEVSRL